MAVIKPNDFLAVGPFTFRIDQIQGISVLDNAVEIYMMGYPQPWVILKDSVNFIPFRDSIVKGQLLAHLGLNVIKYNEIDFSPPVKEKSFKNIDLGNERISSEKTENSAGS